MGHKKPDLYFDEMQDKAFAELIHDYLNVVVDFSKMITKLYEVAQQDESKISMNAVYRMRGLTVDLEKFGKQFRKRTIAMKKGRKNEMGKSKNGTSEK